ncbi:MAG: hypothetical protein DCF20_20085 [Pseudanabaena sp.]|nr:MAG: hypothetical protein DCF20_20085 [Pseudanabaena sp.]
MVARATHIDYAIVFFLVIKITSVEFKCETSKIIPQPQLNGINSARSNDPKANHLKVVRDVLLICKANLDGHRHLSDFFDFDSF